jgi:hypothetical protein
MSRKRGDDWQEARRRRALPDEDMRAAKAPGMSPRSLIKNIPSPSPEWKLPVRDWVRNL